MPRSLIIGSGPAAAGVALALLQDESQQITVIDVGGELEQARIVDRELIASTNESAWPSRELNRITRQPVVGRSGSLPEKRAYGSDYPFRNIGQLNGVKAVNGANEAVVSGAYGGFSNVWGAQVMPFSSGTFDRWPVSRKEMEPHYRSALNEMTVAGETDDLSILFPFMTTTRPLPQLAERTQFVLDRYTKHHALLQSLGITIGRARLALRTEHCTLCGLCMTGCPYQLIYSASHTFDKLRSDRRITYRSKLLATGLSEKDGVPHVRVKDLTTGFVSELSTDRIFVACGGIGTTRLVLGALKHYRRTIQLSESAQFVMPSISIRPTSDPRTARAFTLNQFNLVLDTGGDGIDLSQIHFYPYNPMFMSALPSQFANTHMEPVTDALLRRLSVGLGYIPSWFSPKVRLTAFDTSANELPELVIDREPTSGWPPMLRLLLRQLIRAGPILDLWPVIPKTSLSPAGKSYHFGGSFPHGETRSDFETDRIGRLKTWDKIHLVDASVFPTIPATTFTLTIMANAHRIATEALRMMS